ncbi:MAG: hypothetical protein WB611_09275 [Stellaceae bacterium]
MLAAVAGAGPAADRKTEHYEPGDAARRLARHVQVGTEEKTSQEGRGGNEGKPGQNFEPRCGTRP